MSAMSRTPGPARICPRSRGPTRRACALIQIAGNSPLPNLGNAPALAIGNHIRSDHSLWSILNRLGDMRRLNILRSGQVSYTLTYANYGNQPAEKVC